MPVPPITDVIWHPCWRIVPSRFPPVGLFDAVADPADLEAVFELEALTNDRLRQEAGDLALVPEEDRVSGHGTTPIMAAFTHLSPQGSRFSDGSYGVFYAGRRLQTAVAETRHGRTLFMQATSEPAQHLDMRVYAVDLDAALHDVRGGGGAWEAVHDPDCHKAGRTLGRTLRDAGSDGVAYASVRDPGGECAAVFRPRMLSNCRQSRHLAYIWDGENIVDVYEKRAWPAS